MTRKKSSDLKYRQFYLIGIIMKRLWKCLWIESAVILARFTKVIIDIAFKVNNSYGTSWELLPANDAGTFPISFNDDEVDRVLRCEVFTTLSFFFSLSFSFVSYFTVYRTDCTTKSVTNGATGGMPGCRDNSYGSSGGIFYMDAIIVVKGIRLSVLTGRCAGQSASRRLS